MTTSPASRSRGLRYLYLALCVPGALWPGYYLALGVNGANMVHDLFATPGVALMVADLLLVALVGVLWMTMEARRLGMHWWLYLALAVVAFFSVLFPFFLYRREVVLDTLARPGERS